MDENDRKSKGSGLGATRPLMRHAVVDTRDPDAAREMIGRIFCPHRLIPVGRDSSERFDAHHHTAPFGGLTVNYVAYGARVDIDPGYLKSFFLLQIPLSGNAEVTSGNRTVLAGTERATLLSPAFETRMIWEDGCEKLIVLVPRERIEEQLMRILDHIPKAFGFDPSIDLLGPRGSAILAQAKLMLHLAEAEVYRDRVDVFEQEIASSLVTLLVGHLLDHANTEFGILKPQRVSVAPAHVRRAEEYIRAHLDQALTLPQLAAQAGSSARSLQSSFRHFRQTTISDFILNQRLDCWRGLILSSDEDARVGDLALAVGLNHHGRAATAYRERFGESPSQTMRNRRG